MAVSESKLRSILQDNFPNAQIKIIDLIGDQDHYSVEIKSNMFNGLTLINQHKLVKKALAEVLARDLHAVTIKTNSI